MIDLPAPQPGEQRQQSERDRQLIALRLASPKRANPGATILQQDSTDDCPLFITANEPTLF